jgi:hypothetical protein
VSQTLKISADNAVLVGSAGGAIKVGAEGNRVEYANLKAEHAGAVTLKATLGSADAVEKSFPVFPVGKPIAVDRGGSLAAPRELSLETPKDLEREGARARLLVFPGALALLRSELVNAPARDGEAAHAYALLLAGRGAELLKSLGDEPDDKALRTMSILAAQRAIRDARSPTPYVASLLAEPVLAHPNNPVLSRLGARLIERLASSQRPDGSFDVGNGQTLQRLLVMTAFSIGAVRADATTPHAKQRAIGATLRTEGAFERNFERIEEGYTAAAMLTSGVLKGSLAERLRALVKKGIKSAEDGSKSLAVENGVVRADGQVPSEVEATAFAVLGLAGDPDAAKLLPDLGATLLANYRPGIGWGDGYTNLVALRAVLALFKDPLPDRIKVSLELDGQLLTEGVLEGKARREALALDADLAAHKPAGTHRWSIKAEPPVPGLGFSLTVKGFVPWTIEPSAGGLELSAKMPKELKVGLPAEIVLSAVAPSGMPLVLRHAIPAGVQADPASLKKLVDAGTISSFETADGVVTFNLPALQPGQTWNASYRVIPTLAGTLHTSATTLAPARDPSQSFHLAPAVWSVR